MNTYATDGRQKGTLKIAPTRKDLQKLINYFEGRNNGTTQGGCPWEAVRALVLTAKMLGVEVTYKTMFTAEDLTIPA